MPVTLVNFTGELIFQIIRLLSCVSFSTVILDQGVDLNHVEGRKKKAFLG